ncbi:MAG: DNA primase [Myxococcota bacterium]
MAVSSEQLQAIRDRTDIIRVVGAYVDLKKKGSRYVGLCPFHAEKTPSFSVTQSKGLYYCFGCHAGGDAFSFLMRHQGIDFQTAVRKLGKDAGVEVAAESEAVRRRRKEESELVRVNDYAQAFFEHALWQDGARQARAYLNQRGISEEIARQRRLGYGGGAGELLSYLEAKKVSTKLAVSAGLLTEDGERALFEGRVTFPIFDASERLAGFGARRTGDGSSPKYINSRESTLFSKRKLLYGWKAAQDAIRRTGRVVLVEGYTDVLACQRAGLREAVAALGTAFSEDHAKLVARLAKDAVVVFDADAAGQRASLGVVQRLLGAKLRTLVAPLPAGQDPDNVVAESGADALRQAIDAAVPAVEHFINTAFGEGDLSIEERARAAQQLAPLLHALSSGLERDLYTARLAERVGVSVEQIKKHLEEHLEQHLRAAPKLRPKKQAPQAQPNAAQPSQPTLPAKTELDLLRELLLFPDLRSRLSGLAEFASDPMRLLLDDLACSEAPIREVLSRHLPDGRIVVRLSGIEPVRYGSADEQTARGKRTFGDVLNRFKVRHMQASLRDMRQELQELEARDEPTDDLVRRIQSLTRQEKDLKRPSSRV